MFCGGVPLLPPLSHFSSSLPSKQSGSASQCHRSGMQWPFLHWYWSLSHFTSQPFCANTGKCRPAIQRPLSHCQRPGTHRLFLQRNWYGSHVRSSGCHTDTVNTRPPPPSPPPFLPLCHLCFSPHSSFGSSEASPQSSSPSHFQRAGMQRPESLQRNSSTPHVIWAAINATDKAQWWDRSRRFYYLIDFKKGNIMRIIAMRAMWC
uniref:Uncharacterized protein n=1 Tax=Takifugu rubripes TaxID=31033 RepID=A0A674P078_TAKRU